eukprot:jgi/Tetstr1/439864/TSEL_028275.t1
MIPGRSLKPTLMEFKTMRCGVKYTAVSRATAVDRFQSTLLGDMQRGLAVRDAAWHNTEPGQKGPLRDILDMSEYMGMGIGTMGEVSKGERRTMRVVACLAADRGALTAGHSMHHPGSLGGITRKRFPRGLELGGSSRACSLLHQTA